jgi:hypothetical protein
MSHVVLFSLTLLSAVMTLGVAVLTLTVTRRAERDELQSTRLRLARLEGELLRLAPMAERALSKVSRSNEEMGDLNSLRHALIQMNDELQKLLSASEEAVGPERFVHTLNRGDRWINEAGGRVSGVYATKEEAVNAGRALAQRERTEHVIHSHDGTITERNSYGVDPYKSRTKTH